MTITKACWMCNGTGKIGMRGCQRCGGKGMVEE